MIDNECGMAVMPTDRDSCRLPNDRNQMKMLYKCTTRKMTAAEKVRYANVPRKPSEGGRT